MTKVVLDTNILVSGLISSAGSPGRVVDLLLGGELYTFHDDRILAEYREVLSRDKFPFRPQTVTALIDAIMVAGDSVSAPPLPWSLPDETDRKFYEVAKAAGARLVTGNLKHYPKDPLVLSPADFLKLIERGES